MVGINEMGVGTVDTFIAKYEEVLQRIRELQPGAIIYLQGIMKVTTKRSNQGDYINNQGIEKRNARIEQLADYVSVYYLDVNPLFCNESGGMIPDYTTDGVHLKAKYIPIWKEFLGEHGVKPYGGSNNM
jgi:lysophospholipase L1-like esterase